jgi:DnaK suppressor protein
MSQLLHFELKSLVGGVMKSTATRVETAKSAVAKAPIGRNMKLVQLCKAKLLESKADLLNRVRSTREELHVADRGGDEADQTMRLLAESEALSLQERLRQQLVEIESALARIENGSYGVCEETEEFIESDRLMAIPWTRLSIEGAEIREAVGKRYAR